MNSFQQKKKKKKRNYGYLDLLSYYEPTPQTWLDGRGFNFSLVD